MPGGITGGTPRGMPGGIRLKRHSKYAVTLYELLKSYSNHVMKKNFLSISIPKLPFYTTEEAIKEIKKNRGSGG